MDFEDIDFQTCPQYLTKAILLGASHELVPETLIPLDPIKSFSTIIGYKDNRFKYDYKALRHFEFCILVLRL
jgi:hypothetical protein